MLSLVVGVAMVTWLLLWSTTPPPRLLGVYSRPGFWYWLKVVIFYIIVKVRRWSNKTGGSGADVGYGVKSRDMPELMECVQPLSDHPKAIDAVYFNGANESGHYMVAAAARRPKGVINGLLYLRVPGVGLLQLPKMPDTMLFGDGEQFAAEGLRITPVKPMAIWRIQYKGPMKMKDSPLSRLNVKLDVEWTSEQPYFDFDTDMSARALARSIAREPWSRNYFQGLREAHQSHYEQMGRIEGTVVVDDHPYVLRLDSMRDHSYGYKREWKLMHRYGLHMFATHDGLQGNVGIICQPATCTQLEMGYIYEGGKVTPVSSVSLSLWQHGENGHPPSDYAFSFVAGGKEYVVEVFVLEAPEFYIGWEWETRVVERMATFRINGRKGWGLAEWDYRHHGGRPRAYSVTDPAWTADLVKEAEEEKVKVKSDDDPQCVVHYHGLVDDKTSRIILLSDRSYGKLIECKNMRTELGGEAYHDQCETIPVSGYDSKKDGYHRPCYMKFIKIKMDEKKTKHVGNSENECKIKHENSSENESKAKAENYLENERKTEDENYFKNENKTKNENEFVNTRKIKEENCFESESKTKNENCSEHPNKSEDEQYIVDDTLVKDDYYFDIQSKIKNKNDLDNYTKANSEIFSESTNADTYHSQNHHKANFENYSDNDNHTRAKYNKSSTDETKKESYPGNENSETNAEICSENENESDGTKTESDSENENENESDGTKTESDSENENENESNITKIESYSQNDNENKCENHPENEDENDTETKAENNLESENEDKKCSENVSDITYENNYSETKNTDANQTKAKAKNSSENQGKVKARHYCTKQSNYENYNGLQNRHRRTYMSEENS